MGSVRINPDIQNEKIAIIEIDFPPLNIGSQHMRRALSEALAGLQTRSDLVGAVLVGAGANFVAGSDISEFDLPPVAPHLPDVIAQIEGLHFPVVAALRGAALGGGCELALGCDWRIATPDAVLGLPEATLGLVPGAGGTIRLPRLVGASLAVDLVSSGRRLSGRQAREVGLVDGLAEGDLIDAARQWLLSHPTKRLARDLPVPQADMAELEKSVAQIKRKARGADAPGVAAEIVVGSLTQDTGAALDWERQESLRLRKSPQSRALRYLFQSERRAGRMSGGAEAKSIKCVGLVGAGRMGSDIAFVFARAGLDVLVVEANQDVAGRARTRIAENAERLVGRGELGSAAEVTGRVSFVPMADLRRAELVVEAIPESMDAKKGLFAELSGIVSTETILGTNTSYLDINEIATAASHPERVVGMHFFNPASILKLVEIVQADKTSDTVLATMLRLARRLDKLPIITGVGEGFVGNRIFAAYRRTCEYLLEDGCLPEQVDRAMQVFGMAMGPFAVFDLAGLDIAWAMRKRLAPLRSKQERYVEIPDTLCLEGRFGRAVGQGWYDYVDGKAQPSQHVTDVILAASAAKGITRRSFSDRDISDLLVVTMANEAAWLVHEGVSRQPEDVDVALCSGFGFPRHLGGPLYCASQMGGADRKALIERLVAMSGRPAAPNLEQLLADIELRMQK